MLCLTSKCRYFFSFSLYELNLIVAMLSIRVRSTCMLTYPSYISQSSHSSRAGSNILRLIVQRLYSEHIYEFFNLRRMRLRLTVPVTFHSWDDQSVPDLSVRCRSSVILGMRTVRLSHFQFPLYHPIRMFRVANIPKDV